MPNLIFTDKELNQLRMKLLFKQLESEVIIQELREQGKNTEEKEKELIEIKIELKNIQIIRELNTFLII